MTLLSGNSARPSLILAAITVASIAALAAPLPEGLPEEGRRAAVIGAAMACLWVTEILPLAATALIPAALFPLAGVASLDTTAQAYANPLVFLFLGGFVLAAALERHGLDRRIARIAVALAGRDRRRLVLAVMIATAFLSLWISNTATAMMMTPIAFSLIGSRSGDDGFAPALMLGVAFAATIGGMGSLIGTPPNALFAGYIARVYNVEIGFGAWMLIGLPIVLVLLPIAWLMLTKFAFQLSDAPAPMKDETGAAPPLTHAQRLVALILALTVLAWFTRPFLSDALGASGLSDAGIAILAALALFALPVRDTDGSALLTWPGLVHLRWDVLILFGGGLALAQAIADTGVAEWLGGSVEALRAPPLALVMLVMMAVIVYLGELASNTAMAAIFLPIAGAMATALGADPLALCLAVALAASLGFMLPVATPPNAIVYGSGCVTSRQMLHAGAWLDVISIGVVFIAAQLLGPVVSLLARDAGG